MEDGYLGWISGFRLHFGNVWVDKITSSLWIVRNLQVVLYLAYTQPYATPNSIALWTTGTGIVELLKLKFCQTTHPKLLPKSFYALFRIGIQNTSQRRVELPVIQFVLFRNFLWHLVHHILWKVTQKLVDIPTYRFKTAVNDRFFSWQRVDLFVCRGVSWVQFHPRLFFPNTFIDYTTTTNKNRNTTLTLIFSTSELSKYSNIVYKLWTALCPTPLACTLAFPFRYELAATMLSDNL